MKDDDPVDLEAEQETDAMRTMMRGKKLGDFQGATLFSFVFLCALLALVDTPCILLQGSEKLAAKISRLVLDKVIPRVESAHTSIIAAFAVTVQSLH